MSNHMHIVATDTQGNLPEFMHWVNEYIAKCVNAHLGRWESFWAPGSYSAVRLLDPEDVLAKMVYVYTNAVDAGLVRAARDWPGARSLPQDLGKSPEETARPTRFFRKDGPMPEKAHLEFDLPDSLDTPGADFVRQIARAVRIREEEIRRARRERGLGFLGRRRALKQSPFRRPRSVEPRRDLAPRIAAADKWHRIEVLQRIKEFLNAYREAKKRYREGNCAALFPEGTYWMRVRLGVRCGGP
jgi:hypothetical protein